MKHFLIWFICGVVLGQSLAQKDVQHAQQMDELTTISVSIDHYFDDIPFLTRLVDQHVEKLSDHQKVAQLIMPAMGRLGIPKETIDKLIDEQKIGGVLMLNGTKEEFAGWVKEINAKNKKLDALPFLYGADAEPSLVNKKIAGTKKVKKASEINTQEEAKTVAKVIAKELQEIGINYNFAPVVDMASNKTVGYRGFGANPDNIIPFSQAFIEQMHQRNIIATIKHFPGHGLVVGDTHKNLLYIDGELQEISIFKTLIDQKVTSVMIGHIAVKNNKKYNTNNLPATVSPIIITDLLRNELGFDGLIITDAMGMGGVAKVPNSSVLAVQAGCDIVLMPKDANKAHAQLLEKYRTDPEFKKTVDASVKRIVRMKLILTATH